MKKKYILIAIVVIVLGGVLAYFLTRSNLNDQIVIPFIAHQPPTIDPHLPSSNQLSDKLDEVEFDGLFNAVATPGGVVYEDGLGEFVGIDSINTVTIRLKTGKQWHDSYQVAVDGKKIALTKTKDHFFSASDLNFTLKRIQTLGSLSPDYILVSQALKTMEYDGPDEKGEIHFHFKDDRIWKDADIKEVLSFKILPANSEMNALNYLVGTAPYLSVPQKSGVPNFYKTPDGGAIISNIILAPFIDNSTFTTELKNGTINTLLETPFGSLSPILSDSTKYFTKSNISTTFFALLFNTERLNLAQRKEIRRLVQNTAVLQRFFKINTQQQRQIVDYKGNRNNYTDYLNYSVFPSSSYYVEEKIVVPERDDTTANLALLPNIVNVKMCVNYGFREEYTELADILNDPQLTKQKIKVTAATNEEIKLHEYDVLLIAVSGYRSNFLFDLYNIFLREPDFENYKINLMTTPDQKGGETIDYSSWQHGNNYFGLDALSQRSDSSDVHTMLHDIYGFMSTREIGDKQAYAERIDRLEHQMCLGVWLFSEPSLAYFSTQLDSASVQLYGVASQLSTIKKWKEAARK
ncbi:MAG TPA: hypothetical protein VMU30_00030 [Bacteroidota bacterium]|nr:hypothetical protein [Bacteroidota bacterium]